MIASSSSSLGAYWLAKYEGMSSARTIAVVILLECRGDHDSIDGLSIEPEEGAAARLYRPSEDEELEPVPQCSGGSEGGYKGARDG